MQCQTTNKLSGHTMQYEKQVKKCDLHESQPHVHICSSQPTASIHNWCPKVWFQLLYSIQCIIHMYVYRLLINVKKISHNSYAECTRCKFITVETIGMMWNIVKVLHFIPVTVHISTDYMHLYCSTLRIFHIIPISMDSYVAINTTTNSLMFGYC